MDSDLLLIFGGVGVAILVFIGLERLRKRTGVYGGNTAPVDTPPDSDDVGVERAREPMPERMPVIALTDWGGVLFESGPEKLLLIMLPIADASKKELIQPNAEVSAAIEAVIVVNDAEVEGGHLFGSAVIERFGLSNAVIYATDPGEPIDRGQDSEVKTRKGNQLPKRLRKRDLTLRHSEPGVLELRWHPDGGELRILVGAGIPLEAFNEPPHPQMVFGSIALPGSEDFKPPALDCMLGMKNLTLMKDVPPDTVEKMTSFWTTMGVRVTVVDPTGDGTSWVADTIKLVEALEADDEEHVRDLLNEMDTKGVEMGLIGLAARGEISNGVRLAELAVDVYGDSGELWFQRGVLEFMSGDVQAAEESYRHALDSEPPYTAAACNLSVILLERKEPEAAIEMADRALSSLPKDPVCLQAALSARALSGAREDALALLEERGHLFGRDERIALEEALKNEEQLEAAAGNPLAHRFPMHAKLMLETGRSLLDEGQPEQALEPLRRAHDLDPSNLEAAADLGCALSDLGRDVDAIALYDEAIEDALGGELLRFNRGNAKHRLGRYEDALADYERCHELMPSWLDPGVNIVATLQALDRTDEAREKLLELEKEGAPQELVQQIREQLEA